jgi:hypothetical protein
MVSYTYDIANRLASVNGTTYTWDNNGNLLNDGTNTNAYDSANRLSIVDGPSSMVTYIYNGLGDRLVQNGVHYTLDLNTGLTQVLSDGTNTYLYGLSRIAERQGGVSEYYLADALGCLTMAWVLSNKTSDCFTLLLALCCATHSFRFQ